MAKLTFDERIILRNIDKKFKYIARDKRGTLYVYKHKPFKVLEYWFCNGSIFRIPFKKLFKFIKWEDKKAYKIKDLCSITLTEFFDSNNKEKLAIHCRTRKQAIKLLQEFNKLGKTGCEDGPYFDLYNYWGVYGKNTIYCNNCTYSTINDYTHIKESNIYEFKEVKFK